VDENKNESRVNGLCVSFVIKRDGANPIPLRQICLIVFGIQDTVVEGGDVGSNPT